MMYVELNGKRYDWDNIEDVRKMVAVYNNQYNKKNQRYNQLLEQLEIFKKITKEKK